MSHQENCKKSAKRRDYTFIAKNYQNKKYVKATNSDSNEVSYYNSMYAVNQHLGINAGIVKMVCEKINSCKTGNSKIDNHSYKFEYVNKQDMPDNYKKSAKRRDYTFASKNHQNKKCVKATNGDTNEVSYYNSMYAVNQYLGINAGIVKMVCEKINNCKTGNSKIDNHSYKFEYVNKQDMPDNYKKSANIRSNRVPVEDKKKHHKEAMKRWQQKEYKCSKCGKTYKNSYRVVHNKICK